MGWGADCQDVGGACENRRMDVPKEGNAGDHGDQGDHGDHAAAPADERVLHGARALVLADLTARGCAAPETVSLVEDAVSKRRWWLEQWADGAPYVPGLLAQDVQDALLETYGRWPLCPHCEEPHALAVEPELGADPHWVCEAVGEAIAPVGSLGPAPGPGPGPQDI